MTTIGAMEFGVAGKDYTCGEATLVDNRLLTVMVEFINLHGASDNSLFAYIDAFTTHASANYAQYVRDIVARGDTPLDYEAWTEQGLKRYVVTAEMRTDYTHVVYATDGMAAVDKARELDGGDFTEVQGSGQWEIINAQEEGK